MAREKHTEFITKDILKSSVKGAFQKLDPRYMIKNPVMFVVEVGFFITLLLSIFPSMFGDGGELRIYNTIVTLILFVTILFANFAESVAEGRGKAQAETLKKTKKDTTARILDKIVTLILFVTILFANFAESVAEGRGKAQAETLKKTKKDTTARILDKAGNETVISASQLKKGDVVLVEAGELIPNDGEVIEGIASVDESAITGESAPVTREAGGDFSSVTGGTTVVSDWLKIRITSEPGQSFLDKMISLVEGASRQKTPNEIALNTLLVSLTIIFLIVVVTLHCFADYSQTRIPISTLGASRQKTPNEIALNTLLVSLTIIFLIVVVTLHCFADYSQTRIPISTLIALLVCLIPTTIGGLLSAIGIAGMDRVTRFNVIAMSGKAVEACGDVDTMILDKTGTITRRPSFCYRYCGNGPCDPV